MKQHPMGLRRRLAALAAAGGILLLTMAGCGIAGRAEPVSTQVGATQVGAVQGAASEKEAPAEDSAAVSGDQEQRKTPTATPTRAPPTRIDGLLVIYVDELPREARTTLGLIEQDGPFPYSKDGSIFQNREGILPERPRGYYREYTVITPGENDRGARRIVAGTRGEMYYTDDHYDSFSRIMER